MEQTFTLNNKITHIDDHYYHNATNFNNKPFITEFKSYFLQKFETKGIFKRKMTVDQTSPEMEEKQATGCYLNSDKDLETAQEGDEPYFRKRFAAGKDYIHNLESKNSTMNFSNASSIDCSHESIPISPKMSNKNRLENSNTHSDSETAATTATTSPDFQQIASNFIEDKENHHKISSFGDTLNKSENLNKLKRPYSLSLDAGNELPYTCNFFPQL